MVVTDIIETKLSEEQRGKILRRLDEGDNFNDEETERFTLDLEWFARMADAWVREGTIEKSELDIALHDIVGALKGMDPDARSEDRFRSALNRLLSPYLG